MKKKTWGEGYPGNFNEPGASMFLSLLISTDLCFIALHSLNALAPLPNGALFSLERDRAYPEVFQYLKWLWIIMALLRISMLRRSYRYLAWVPVFVYFLCDDALSIHETVGRYLGEQLALAAPFGLRPQDLGELMVSGLAGVALLFPLAWAYGYGPSAFRKVSQDMVMLISLLVFFGVVVDMAHVSFQMGAAVDFFLGVVEDGGEMVVASLTLWYVFLLAVRGPAATSYLCEAVRTAISERSGAPPRR